MVEALEHQDVELAQIVIADDDRIDGRYLEVHQGILSLLALQAPVAGDLRLVAALLHLIKHIERMGDQCVNIAKLIPLERATSRRVDEASSRARCEMGAHARAEVRQCQAAFAMRDVALAEDLVRQDGEVNRLNREIFQLAIEIGDEVDMREWAMHMILVARAIRAHRRQRGGHRRADRVRRDRPVPRVLGLLAADRRERSEREVRCRCCEDPVIGRPGSGIVPVSLTTSTGH